MNVELTQSEIQNTGLSVPEFRGLQLAEQRWIAARIYRTHLNERDQEIARLIDLAHPYYSTFTILLGQ